jgi:hypothetical protein
LHRAELVIEFILVQQFQLFVIIQQLLLEQLEFLIE